MADGEAEFDRAKENECPGSDEGVEAFGSAASLSAQAKSKFVAEQLGCVNLFCVKASTPRWKSFLNDEMAELMSNYK